MASTINAISTGGGGIATTADATGILQLQTNGTTAITVNASQVVSLANALPIASGGTGITDVGTSGNLLTSNGTSWVSSAPEVTLTGTQTLTNKTITGLKESKVTLSALDINISLGNYFTKTISTASTFTVSNIPTAGTAATFILDVTNGGSSLITWWSGIKWASGTAPTLTTSGRDVIGFFTHDAGTTWNGLVLGKGMA
jgi:hypothetical protein